MSSFREKFKATSGKTLESNRDMEAKMMGSSHQKNEYLQLEDGGKPNRIRIFPFHPESNHPSYYVPRRYYWLPIVGNDGEIRRTTVSDSRMHGKTEMDIVDEYIRYARKHLSSDQLAPFTREKDALRESKSYVCYASIVDGDEELTPKIWEYKQTVRDELLIMSSDEDSDGMMEVDPFTDPDTGKCVIVRYHRKPDKKRGEKYYDVKFPNKNAERPITDEELEKLEALKPLDEIFNRYTIEDFDRALKALQTFDEEEGLGIFDEDAWLEIVEKVREQYGESEDSKDDDEDEKPATKKKSEKPTPKKPAPEPEEEDEEDGEADDADEEDEEDGGDDLDDLDRTQLKRVISSEGLGITVKKSHGDDDIRELIRKARAEVKAEDAEDTEDEADDEEAPEEEDSIAKKKDGIRRLLDRRKLKK